MAKKAVQTNAENFGYFNPRNVYRPEILSIELVGEWNPNDGAINTYRITQNDGKIFDFDVKNGSGGSAGRSVESVEQIQISTESLGKNIARINLSDGTYTDVEIRNGGQGGVGPQGERGPAGIDSVEASIGTNDPTQAPSVDKDLTEGVLSLTFNNIKGEKGDKGDKGNTGSSVDFPYELVTDVETDDDEKGLAASQGVVLDNKISQLGQYEENPQYIRAVTDNNGKVLYGVNPDGNFFFGAGCPKQVKDYVSSNKEDIKEDIIELLNGKVDKIEGKGLSTNDYDNTEKAIVDMSSLVENYEWAHCLVDLSGKVIEGINNNGEKEIFVPFGNRVFKTNEAFNREWLYAITDERGKVIEGLRKDGKKFFVGVPDSIKEYVHGVVYPDVKKPILVWLGSSITEGGTYPVNASAMNGCIGINNGVGGSGICINPNEQVYSEGYSNIAQYVEHNNGYGPYRNLSETIAEKQHRQELYDYPDWDTYKDMILGYSYENLLMPYLDGTNEQQADFVIFDFGINDRYIIEAELLAIIQTKHPNVVDANDVTKDMIDEISDSDIDWTNRDRTTFVGAYGYLLDRIWEIDPFKYVIQTSYLERNAIVPYMKGAWVCKMQELCANHYQIPFVKVYEQTHMTLDWAVGSREYALEQTAKYGTIYYVEPNQDGDYTFFGLMNPDTIHPNSDRSGRTSKMLDEIFGNMLRKYIIGTV